MFFPPFPAGSRKDSRRLKDAVCLNGCKPSWLNGRSLPLNNAGSRKTPFRRGWRIAAFSSLPLKHPKTGKVSLAGKKFPGSAFPSVDASRMKIAVVAPGSLGQRYEEFLIIVTARKSALQLVVSLAPRKLARRTRKDFIHRLSTTQN